MAKGKNKINKALNQSRHFQKLNKKYYVKMREAELTLDQYEQNVAAQITALTSHYEGIICYLMQLFGCESVAEADIAAWASDKEYVLTSEYDEQECLLWVPVVREVEEDETE